MLIRNMNSIFKRHGRWIFGVITILIAISFLGFFTPGFSSIFGGPKHRGSVGEIFGEPLSNEAFTAQVNRLYIMSLLQFAAYGDQKPPVRTLRERAYQGAFSWAVMSKAAQLRGIKISDEEVAAYIVEDPAFQENGHFSMDKMNKFVDEWLKPDYLTAGDLDESIRAYLSQAALERSMTENVLITPAEIALFNRQLNEKNEIAVADFKAQDYLKEVKLTEKDLEAYYKTNASKYRIPVSFNALIAVFRPEQVKATDAQLKKYFEGNKQLYSADGKAVAFDKVKSKVAADYSAHYGKVAAQKKAGEFAVKLYEQMEDKQPDAQRVLFEKQVIRDKAELVESGWFFADTDNIRGIQEPVLIGEFSKLYKIPVTNPVLGKDAVYVGLLLESKESRPATFAEVKDKVRSELAMGKAVEIARQKARNLVKALAESKGKTAELVKKDKMFKVLPVYSMMMPPQGEEAFNAVRVAESLPVGGFSPAENTNDGAMVVVVLKRTEASKEELANSLSNAELFYKMNKRRVATAAFQAWLQANTKQYKYE
mgnify:CR=1 FL=1